MLKVKIIPSHVTLKDTFKVSRESYRILKCVYVVISNGENYGLGEATEFMVDVYNSNAYEMCLLEDSVNTLLADKEALPPQELWGVTASFLKDYPFLQCALDVAYWDLYAKNHNLPLHELICETERSLPKSNYSIGICSMEKVISEAIRFEKWPYLKLKLGSESDIGFVGILSKVTQAKISVDVNCGWSFDEAKHKIFKLHALGVTEIEQPLAVDKWDECKKLKEISPITLTADESCTDLQSLDRCIDCFDKINIKLMKAGGITPALQMISIAREMNVSVMMGCMPESFVGVSAISQLAPMLDSIEVDSVIHIKDHKTSGVEVSNGNLNLSKIPGTSARFTDEYLLSQLNEFMDTRHE